MTSQASAQMMANAIRALSMDAVQKAKSGHPGMPMGMADIATALWSRHLRFNPTNPKWTGRDRFILSNGHGSMLQYALLHLTGYDLSIDDLKAFRQLHSKTPGHPEVDVTPGVETTTGPLGQGIANGVGMALAEKMLANEFNREGFPVFDNRTYVFLGDGCMMEGISHEVCSLAGVWKLNKLIAIYDDNGISIDGDVKGWFGDDTRGRFEAYGWNVIGPVDGHDIDAMDAAIAEAKLSEDKPTLIIARTTIGKGSPNRQGTAKVHGEALGDEEIAATRAAIGWPYAPFEVPQEVYDAWDHRAEGARIEAEWQTMFEGYAAHGGSGAQAGEQLVVVAAAVAQARAGAVESNERHDNHVEGLGGHDGEVVAVDVRGCEGPRRVGDKRGLGRIAGRDCPHAHALAACGGVACREHARIGYTPATRDGRGGKRGWVDLGTHGGIDGNGALARSVAGLHQLNKLRADNGRLRCPHIQIKSIALGNHRLPQLSLVHPNLL